MRITINAYHKYLRDSLNYLRHDLKYQHSDWESIENDFDHAQDFAGIFGDKKTLSFLLKIHHAVMHNKMSGHEAAAKLQKKYTEYHYDQYDTPKQISQESFDQIKEIAKALKKEIDYYNKHHTDNDVEADFDDDWDFSNLINPKVDGADIANTIDENLDILSAANLNVINSDSVIEITYGDLDPVYDDSLDVVEVYGVMKNLIRLGRTGIKDREKRNGEYGRTSKYLQNKMDLPATM